jgi:hypothetical protein
MKLQKNLSMQREGQLEFDAPGHKGAPHHLSKNRNSDRSQVGKKRPIRLQAYGVEISDSPTLAKFED